MMLTRAIYQMLCLMFYILNLPISSSLPAVNNTRETYSNIEAVLLKNDGMILPVDSQTEKINVTHYERNKFVNQDEIKSNNTAEPSETTNGDKITEIYSKNIKNTTIDVNLNATAVTEIDIKIMQRFGGQNTNNNDAIFFPTESSSIENETIIYNIQDLGDRFGLPPAVIATMVG